MRIKKVVHSQLEILMPEFVEAGLADERFQGGLDNIFYDPDFLRIDDIQPVREKFQHRLCGWGRNRADEPAPGRRTRQTSPTMATGCKRCSSTAGMVTTSNEAVSKGSARSRRSLLVIRRLSSSSGDALGAMPTPLPIWGATSRKNRASQPQPMPSREQPGTIFIKGSTRRMRRRRKKGSSRFSITASVSAFFHHFPPG